MDRLELSWPQIDKMVEALADRITKQFRPEELRLVPLGRGALVPTGLLAYKLNTQDIALLWQRNRSYPPKIMLFVDDISDTGLTIRRHRSDYSTSYTNFPFYATLVTRATTQEKPHFTGFIYPGDDFIVFPWAPNDTPTRREDFQDGGEEGYDFDGGEVRPLPSDLSESDSGEVREGGEELRGAQLGEGHPVGQYDQACGDAPEQPQIIPTRERSESGG